MKRAAWHLLRSVGTIVVVVSTVFVLTSLLPGDAASVVAGPDQEAAADIRAGLGLDRALPIRLGVWWQHTLRGDLGQSWLDGADVIDTLGPRLLTSAAVATPAWLLAMIGAVVLAVTLGGLRVKGRVGRATQRVGTGVVAALAGVPETVLVVVLVLWLAVAWQCVPAVSLMTPGVPPWEQIDLLVLPTLALAIPVMMFTTRVLSGVAEEIWQRRVCTSASRRGVSTLEVAWVHVLPAMTPALAQAAAIAAAGILGAGAVAESLLAYPGIGQLLATSLASRDLPVVQGISLVLATVAVGVFWVADHVAAIAARKVRR